MTGRSPLLVDRETLRRIEQAAVKSWPAIEAAEIDGWTPRYSSGGSLRANTVSALHYTGTDIDVSIQRAIDFYRSHGGLARFTVTDVAEPSGLDDVLARGGWVREGDHVTMTRAIGSSDAVLPPGEMEIEFNDAPTPEWMAVYLAGQSESRKAVAPRLVAGVPEPRVFLSCRRGGAVVGSGLTVVDGEFASVQCMATLAVARRAGVARAILGAIEAVAGKAGCKMLYLQTELSNEAAVALYRRIGFAVAGRYHIRQFSG